MSSDKPPVNVLPFARVRRFPADLDRLRSLLDDEYSEFDEADIDDGLACAEAAIARGYPAGHDVKADFLNMRAHRTLGTGDTDAALAAWAAIKASYPTYLKAYTMCAYVLGKRGDHDAALAELDRYVELSPTDAQGYLHRAGLYQARGDGDRALANYRRATQLDPALSEAQLSIAQLLAAKGDAAGAARAYARAAEEVLGDAESYNLRAFMHFVSGQEELALADYESSIALNPNDPETVAWRGLCRVRLKRYDGAIADFTRLISMQPSEARGYWRRGEALVHAGKPADALRDLDRAIALGEDERGAAHFARGMAHEALGDVKTALASYDIAIERDPSNVACRLRRFQIHDAAEDWKRCQVDAEAMLSHAPDNPSILHTHARLCVRNDRRDDARAAYDRLLALDPGNADAYHERAALHVGKGDTLAARADVMRAFELAPDAPDIRAAYGRELGMMARTDDERAAAVGHIARSAELDAENPEAWANAADCLRSVSCHAEAVRCSTRAIEIAPDKAEYYDLRARAIRAAAPPVWVDPEGFRAACLVALADVEKALALSDGEDIELYRLRAELAEETGDLEQALADQTKMIEIDPEFYDAHADRARLRKRMGDMPGALADAAHVAAMEEETIAELTAAGYPANLERFNLDKV